MASIFSVFTLRAALLGLAAWAGLSQAAAAQAEPATTALARRGAGATPTPLTSIADASGGSGIFAYQWESSADNNNWTAIPGATTATFAPGALTATTYYRRRVTSGVGACSVGISNVLTIQVQSFVTPTVSVDTPPVQCAGTALTFTAVVANAGNAPTFRWLVNNVAVATGPTFTSSTLVTGDQVRGHGYRHRDAHRHDAAHARHYGAAQRARLPRRAANL